MGGWDDAGEHERLERACRVFSEIGRAIHPLSKQVRGRAESAFMCVKGKNWEGAREEFRLAVKALGQLVGHLDAGRFGDDTEAGQLMQRAHARAGRLMGLHKLEVAEAQKVAAEVVPLKASELFGKAGSPTISSSQVLEAMRARGVDGQFVGEYLAEFLQKTRERGSMLQRKEALKLLFAYIQHIEPRTMFEFNEEDLDALSDEELEAYQTLCAKMVAKEIDNG